MPKRVERVTSQGEIKVEDDFLSRLRSTVPSDELVDEARERYPELPDDVLEEVAKQLAVAQPVIRQYHIFHDETPSLAVARGSAHEVMDEAMDDVISMDMSDLGDVGALPSEYKCPDCGHEWSGCSHPRYGWGEKVYGPTGRLTRRGTIQRERYGPPIKYRTKEQQKKFKKYEPAFASSPPEKKPRGWGNQPVGDKLPNAQQRKEKREQRGKPKPF